MLRVYFTLERAGNVLNIILKEYIVKYPNSMKQNMNGHQITQKIGVSVPLLKSR